MSRPVSLGSQLMCIQPRRMSFLCSYLQAKPAQSTQKPWQVTHSVYTGPVIRQGFEIDWLRWLPVFKLESAEVPGIVTARALVRFFFRLFMRGGCLATVQRGLALFIVQTSVWLHSSLVVVTKNKEDLVPRLEWTDVVQLSPQTDSSILVVDNAMLPTSLLTSNLELKPIVTYGQQRVSLSTLAQELGYSAWNIRYNTHQPSYVDGFNAVQITPPQILAWVGLSLKLTYRVKYFALDRKLRKIVKNKYRYVRAYVCVRETQRVRYGLRLLLLGSLLQAERKWSIRVAQLLLGLFKESEANMLRQVRSQHQRVTLRVLGLV